MYLTVKMKFLKTVPHIAFALGATALLASFILHKPSEIAVFEAAELAKPAAYLTYDDGPSPSTPDLLKVLKSEGVNATFFVTAQQEECLNLITEAAKAGHVVAPHSYKHDYREIYASSGAFWEDFGRICTAISERTDGEVPALLRFPGGCSNTVSLSCGGHGLMAALALECAERGIKYIDWNIDTRDGAGGTASAEGIFGNFKRGYDSLEDKSELVILMHDAAPNSTVDEASKLIIDFLKDAGYEFKTADKLSCDVHHAFAS